ncbi:unnamed protein product [Camellia sinensis]
MQKRRWRWRWRTMGVLRKLLSYAIGSIGLLALLYAHVRPFFSSQSTKLPDLLQASHATRNWNGGRRTKLDCRIEWGKIGSAATSSGKIGSQTEKIDAKAQEMKIPILEEAFVSESVVASVEERVFVSTLGTVAAVVDPEIQKTEKDVSAETQKRNDHILQDVVVSKPEVCEVGTNLNTGSFVNMEDSRDLVEKNSIVQTDVEGTSAITANAESMNDVLCEKPTAPDAFVLEMEVSVLDVTTDKCEDQSTPKEVDAEASESNDPILQEVIASKFEAAEPETKINTGSSENVANPIYLVKEGLLVGANVEGTSDVPLNADPLDDVPCKKTSVPDALDLHLTMNKCDDQSEKQDAKEQEMECLVVGDATVSEPGETKSFGEEKISTSSMFETDASIPEIEKTKKQDAEAQASNDLILQDALLKPWWTDMDGRFCMDERFWMLF